MKSKKLNKKLNLNKKTVAHLRAGEMKRAYGGGVTKPPTRCECPTGGCPTREIIICTTF